MDQLAMEASELDTAGITIAQTDRLKSTINEPNNDKVNGEYSGKFFLIYLYK